MSLRNRKRKERLNENHQQIKEKLKSLVINDEKSE